ncbi:Sugar transport protein 1 [Acorus gramineus]|uniref:Sugar transport protein 1 n=1 Tax=Acorus gramineus TaxID=55184 RepID=A0AAV9B8N5_ACOGR|nr:Sugar transport protein 1 [Acorus gramineus]
MLAYLSKMAPANHRGKLNFIFYLMNTFGIFAANSINYGTSKSKSDKGWRTSLGLPAVPAFFITLGSLFLPDTPDSLINRGHNDAAKVVLRRIRDTLDIDQEYADLVTASEASQAVGKPWRDIFRREHIAHFKMAVVIPLFQQFTGTNAVTLYMSLLFRAIGFSDHMSLLYPMITTGLANIIGTLLAVFIVGRWDRRTLFLVGGIQMIVCQAVVGGLVTFSLGTTGVGTVSAGYASSVVVFICFYIVGNAYSWGSWGWLISGEIFPLEIRSAEQMIDVCVSMLCQFVIAQFFPTMVCLFKSGIFFFYAFFAIIMTTFIFLFMPEGENMEIEEMLLFWKERRFLRRSSLTRMF